MLQPPVSFFQDNLSGKMLTIVSTFFLVYMPFYSYFLYILNYHYYFLQFSLLYRASMDSSFFYCVEKLKELPYRNKGILSR